jgi:multiple antibiotic resistance protein
MTRAAGAVSDGEPMSVAAGVKFFWEVFVTLVVITDPPGVVPPFLSLTHGLPARVRARLAWQAAVVALGVIMAFALFGRPILSYLGVELPSLEAAGGLLLLLVALQLLTGQLSEPTAEERATANRANIAFVPLGTPLLAGPGAIVATMLFVQRARSGVELAAFAIAAVAVVLWLTMRYSTVILRLLRPSGVELVTRIAGLLLSAIAVQLAADAIRAFTNWADCLNGHLIVRAPAAAEPSRASGRGGRGDTPMVAWIDRVVPHGRCRPPVRHSVAQQALPRPKLAST